MKILLCHSYYQQPGGERRAVEQQRELLLRRGHQVTLLTRDNRDVVSLGPVGRLRLAVDTVWSRRTYREVLRRVAAERPDVAHVHNVFPLLSPSLYGALRHAGVPVAQTIHNFRFLCPNGLFYTHGEICERCSHGATWHAVRLRCYRDSGAASAVYALAIGLHRRLGTFRHIDRHLALTDFARHKLVASGLAPAERVSVLGPFLPAPQPPAVEPDSPPYALFLGRLAAEKGADLLIDAFAALPGYRLVIAGEGPQAASLRARVAQRAPHGCIELVGHVGGDEKDRLLRRAAITVIPSRWYEGLPFAALESLAAGVPVVASNLGGLRALLAGTGAGLLFRPGDAADLRRSLAEVLSQPELRRELSAAALRLVAERYSEEIHYRGLLAVYRELMEGNRAA